MRFALAFILAAPLAACATSPSTPDTSTGQLAKATDINYQCDDSARTFSCGVNLAFADGQLTATGLYKDGTAGAAMASGMLTPTAQADLDDLVSQLPLSTPDMITEENCGGAPLRSTTFAIQFDNGQLRDFTYQYGSGVAQQIDEYVLEVVRQVNACSGDRVTFDSCTPNVAP